MHDKTNTLDALGIEEYRVCVLVNVTIRQVLVSDLFHPLLYFQMTELTSYYMFSYSQGDILRGWK